MLRRRRDSEPGTVTGIQPNGLTVAMEPSEAIHALAEWAYTALSATDGAANYVEQEAWADLGGESRRLVVIAAWSPEQTPARLREEAERRARELEAQAGDPSLWDDPAHAQKVTTELSNVQARLKKVSSLRSRIDDLQVLHELREIKAANKRDFADWIAERQGVQIDPDSIFDTQIKRLHEYKRQLMNAL